MALGGREILLRRPRDPDALATKEAYEADEFLPYWAELWPVALELAEAVIGRALKGARVVELGCGLGLPSIAAALAGGRVLATDWASDAAAVVAANAELNGVHVDTAVVDWREPDELLARGPFDLLLASDVLYENRNLDPLLAVLPRLAHEAWIADPGRPRLEGFLADAGRGWDIETHGRIHRLRRREPEA